MAPPPVRNLRPLHTRAAAAVALMALALTASPAYAGGADIGSLDPAFGAGGVIRITNPDADPSLTADLHVMPDGRIAVLVPGDPTTVLRFLQDGTPDTSFGG